MPGPLETRIAVTCLADLRLRGVCSILLRHAGYRVIETKSVEEAAPAIEADGVSILVSGVLADPENRLARNAKRREIPCLRVAPKLRIEAILRLFEAIQE